MAEIRKNYRITFSLNEWTRCVREISDLEGSTRRAANIISGGHGDSNSTTLIFENRHDARRFKGLAERLDPPVKFQRRGSIFNRFFRK